MYLLDTNVLAELRKAKTGQANERVLHWARSVPTQSLFISTMNVLEIEIGIQLIARRDTAQAERLRVWLEHAVLGAFAGRILPIDLAIARRCAALHVPDPRPERDALIAATALVHRMRVVTRNVTDFEAMDVAIINPWQ